jgi:chorismate mutase
VDAQARDAHRTQQGFVKGFVPLNHLLRRNLIVTLAALLFAGMPGAYGQNNSLQELVQISADRLQLARKVALAKWDSGAAVEDPAREQKVIDAAVKQGQEKGLDGAQVASFFQAQIEANKVIQYSLLSTWRGLGQAPAHGPVDLTKEIRPQLDRIQVQIIEALSGTATVRSNPGCAVDLARTVQSYLKTHDWPPDSRDAVALERSMGATCFAGP